MNSKKQVLREARDYLAFQNTLGTQNVPRVPPKVRKSAKAAPASADKALALSVLQQSLAGCKKCRLCEQRNNIVFGVGNPHATLMFVGEAPGRDEDAKGEPFVGRAGKLLDKIIEAMNLKREEVYIGNVAKCLRYNAMVQLANGSWERIGRLVRNRYAGKVLAVSERGEIVQRQITGWHETALGSRSVYKLSYHSSRNTGKSFSGIYLTGDHPVLTKRGYVNADKLKKDDLVAIGQGFSVIARDVIMGSILGDCSMSKQQAIITMAHSQKQEKYLRFKYNILKKELGGKFTRTNNSDGVSEKKHPSVRYTSHSHRALKLMRDQFYPKGKKVVPKNLTDNFSPLMLAIWFMDDGYTRIRKNKKPLSEIATHSFSKHDISLLLRCLNKLGLQAYSQRKRIYFSVPQTKKLSETIAPFIPPSMRYKLHPEVEKKIKFQPSKLKTGSPVTLYDYVVAQKIRERGTDKTYFCIDVEEVHNFVTAGGVVHNCRPPENRQPAPDEMATCLPFLREQINIIQPQIIVTLGATAIHGLLATEEKISQLRGKWINWDGVWVMPTYHPAFLLRNPAMKKPVWEDMQKVMEKMKELL